MEANLLFSLLCFNIRFVTLPLGYYLLLDTTPPKGMGLPFTLFGLLSIIISLVNYLL